MLPAENREENEDHDMEDLIPTIQPKAAKKLYDSIAPKKATGEIDMAFVKKN